MATKRLLMRQIREILRLKHERGLANRAIARACGIGVTSVSDYLRRAKLAEIGWPLPEGLDDRELEGRLFPPFPASQTPRTMPDLVHLHEEMKRPGVTLQLLWIEYRQELTGGYQYSQFCEIYRRWVRLLTPTMRQSHRAGEKLFVDFSGKRPSIVNPRTGESSPVELFVGVLGASSYTYAEALPSQQLPHWIAAHVRMFEYIGGCTEILVPDNLKSGVTTPCRYEPLPNRTYGEMAQHYGAVVIPARPYRPRDKAKAEVAVQVVQRWILARLRNRTFFSLEDLNSAIRELLVVLNDRPMKHLGASRRELYERLDRPALKPLPSSRFEMSEWKDCRANIDYHIAFDHNSYSVPYQLRDQNLTVRATITTVEIFHGRPRIASHMRLHGRGGFRTLLEHMPRSHQAHAEWTPSRIIDWAGKTGAATGRLVAGMMNNRPHPEQGFKASLGIIRLARRHGNERVEAACARAERLHSYSYKTVNNILAARQEALPFEEPEEPTATPPAHENIRGAGYYQQGE